MYKSKVPDKPNYCRICETEMTGKYAINKKYCSSKCRVAQNKKRYREKPGAAEWFRIVEYCNERDGYKCVECGADSTLVVHHKQFLCDGGSNHPDNLETLCQLCHLKKHHVDGVQIDTPENQRILQEIMKTLRKKYASIGEG
tara:strand:+ start:54 stop:479 length:426 start_codon:yes stop_codon:yes gene_type:complete